VKLKGKNIILGITGGIAAYKSAFLTRLLIKEGAEVKIVITPLGKEFITPVTLATLSKNTVLSDFFKHDDGEWNSHVDLGIWADLMIIAPATANTMAKMAHGICDNLLLTTYLSARCPVMIAPAMDLDMFSHPATLKNIETLKEYGNIIIEPGKGELASGLEGKGRMEEPENIVEKITEFFNSEKKKINKKVLVTAGPTYEKIDTVRFIGNYSSGKMGYAIADELANRGAEVTLVSGPVSISPKNKKINVISVESAEQMYSACIDRFDKMDAAILSAAVADFTPKEKYSTKIKRGDADLKIDLLPTKDIAAELGKRKSADQILVGFALESENEVDNALRKLDKKNLDFIVLNSLQDKGAGFNFDTNKISILEKDNKIKNFELKSKQEAAIDIVDALYNKIM
jgi:phosphopantothenoylcysteine decarboxylase/phosphopantothenate--cysteine ligase